ncbi:MAG TPA: ABC transporter permease subunit [Candidatus Dormibacteraeota bacterium]|jgi:ABC-2 type transport system permease protein|nr:ABC transporter permease subunit [Candidatus Dormibacteraeota bacterium]
MTNIWTIARKEMKVYYVSPMFYIVTAFFVALFAVLFDYNLLTYLTATLSTTFGISIFIFVFVAPITTMRLIAQEKQQGTLELLMSNPVRDYEVVLGKFLAAMVMLASMLAFTLVSVAILLWTAVDRGQFLFLNVGRVDLGPVLAGYFGFLLIAGGYMAIGLLASSLTQNQILAAFIAFATLLVVLFASTLSSIVQGPLSDFFSYLGSNAHVEAFGRGQISLPDLVYALTLIGVPLYLAVVALGARRWH